MKRIVLKSIIISSLVILVALSGSARQAGAQDRAQTRPGAAPARAIAVLHPTQGNQARGVVTFSQEAGGVRVVAKLTNVPKGVHGFHIHEFGDCSSADGASAGGHFNPSGAPHAGPDGPMRHAGDMGNITADDQGGATLDVLDKHMTMSGPESIIGRGLILHAQQDDLTTQPTGNAGARISCGVIGAAKG